MKENNNQLELDNTNPFDKIGFEEKDVKEVEQQVNNHISSKNTPNVDDNNFSGEINYNKDTVLHLEKRTTRTQCRNIFYYLCEVYEKVCIYRTNRTNPKGI